MRLWLAIVKETGERVITRPGRMGGYAVVIEDAIVAGLRSLPVDKKQEVLDFVEFLARRSASPKTPASPEGLWADLDITLSAEDIAEARREMWGNFPRDDV